MKIETGRIIDQATNNEESQGSFSALGSQSPAKKHLQNYASR